MAKRKVGRPKSKNVRDEKVIETLFKHWAVNHNFDGLGLLREVFGTPEITIRFNRGGKHESTLRKA